jgi:CheY-like chemotaxis protein
MSQNILLVDDEAGIIHAIRRMLRSEDFNIFEANSGDEALAILERHDIHLMISDYKMPGMNGLTLCHKSRAISPTTYRLLLSGQVDYAQLRQASQDGDVHRFVAKPWDNLLLTMDIKEGLKQHQLLARMHLLSQELQGNQPTLLTDSNWIVRLANAPMCRALNCSESELLGVNLFATTLSDMPVTMETEVTRQVEDGKTWLGHFTLNAPDQSRHQSWMAIAPLGEQYRMCSCQWVSEDREPLRDIQDELDRYSGDHHLSRLQQAAGLSRREPQLMMVSVRSDGLDSKDMAAICYERLQAATDDLYEIYSPKPETFLILLPATVSEEQTERLSQNIQQDFNDPVTYQGQSMVLQPDISIEQKPGYVENWEDWLRLRLGLTGNSKPQEKLSVATSSEDSAADISSRFRVMPVFNQAGTVVALAAPSEALPTNTSWKDWLADVCRHWNKEFSQPLHIIMNATEHRHETVSEFSKAIADCETPVKCTVVLGEDCILSQDDKDIRWQAELRGRQCELLIANFGRSYINSRQILSLPIQGVCLAPEFLTHMRNSKSLPQSRRLLQRIHDHGMKIYAPNMDTTESLASAHQSNVDWLSGSVLSTPVSCDQLTWFSASGEIG